MYSGGEQKSCSPGCGAAAAHILQNHCKKMLVGLFELPEFFRTGG